MEIFQWVSLFIIALIVVLKSAQIFTDAAEKIGLHFKISPFIVGVIIVTIGTTLPEMFTSAIAVMQGHSEIVAGNVLGSIITNILLVLAISAIVGKNLRVNREIIKIDLPILLCSVIFLFLTTLDGIFTYLDGTLGLFALASYIIYNSQSDRQVSRKESRAQTQLKVEGAKHKMIPKRALPLKYFLMLMATATLLYFSSDLTITSVIKLSEIFDIGAEIIAISAIAIGTSLPELAVAVQSARQGKIDITIGNVTGANIFNAFGVMGISSFVGPVTIPPEFIIFSIPAVLFITILYVFVTMDKEISTWEGITMLILYLAFLGKTFGVI